MIENIEKFKGVFVAFYACYDDDGNVSEEKIRKLANWYVEKGVNGLYLTGSSGEGMMLTKEERMQTVSAVMEAVGGKITVIAHVGAPSTKESCELAAQAAAVGVDAISSVPNIYYPLPENCIAIGVHADTSATHYVLWPQSYQGESVNYQATNAKRSTGWHQFTWDARSGTGIDMYIDGEKILTDTTRTSFSQITLGWWTAAVGTTNAFDNVVISNDLPWEVEEELEISVDNMTGETAGATITAPNDGWAEGTNTFTVSCDVACVVAISNDNGTTYTRLTATATDGAYSFTAENVTADTKIVIIKIGDTDGDGQLATNDAAVAKSMNLGSITDVTVNQMLAVDLNGDGTITANEVAVVKAATLGNVLSW